MGSMSPALAQSDLAFSKSFSAASIPVGGTTTLTFTLNDNSGFFAILNVNFTDTLPAGLVVATPSNLSFNGPCAGGTKTATSGSNTISWTGGILFQSDTGSFRCIISVDVTGTTPGVKNNSVTATGDEAVIGPISATATASIMVVAPQPPSITKAFGAASINVGASTSLSFTINNPNSEDNLTGVGFTDNLPAGLVIATPNGLSGSCGGGTITAAQGSGNISLSGATLGASASCTFSANITAASAGTKNNTTTQVTSNEGGNGNAASATIVVNEPATTPTTPSTTPTSAMQSRVTIVEAAIGRDGSFSFSSTLPGGTSFILTTIGGSASQSFQNLGAGTFTVTQATPQFGFKLTSVQCDGVAQPAPTATITLTGSNSVTCTFTDTFDTQGIQTATQAAIRNFLNHRANAITSSEPDGTRGNGRLTGWLFGGADNGGQPPGGPTPLMGRSDTSAVTRGLASGVREDADPAATRAALYSPFRLSGSAEDGSGAVLFSTSLTQMRQAAADAAKNKDLDPAAMGLGGPAPRSGRLGTSQPALYDIWFEAHTNFYDDNRAATKQSGHTHLFFVGADYRLHPAILVGVLAQFDWAGESSSVLGTSADGQGWMVGPYLAMRLTQNIGFDGRAAWGQSRDHVNPFGLFEDSFSTSRSLVSGRLIGNWYYGAVRFSPSAQFIYFRETQHDYIDAINVFIPQQTVALGRFALGPEVGYRFKLYDGGMFEPFVGLKGIWDFDRDANTTVGGFVVGNDAWHAKVEAGVILLTPWGMSVRATAAYDGIGENNFSLYQGRLLATVPLN